jgi:hypothetical protein
MSTIISETALDNGLIRYQYEGWYEEKSAPTVTPDLTAEEIAADARAWRDAELTSTDRVVPLSDHPQRGAYLSYRTALRDWPSTSEFPSGTKPALGS